MERGLDWFGLFLRLDGRIGRRAFWVGFVVVFAGLVLADLLSRGVPVAAPLTLALLYPLTAVLVKRLHDRGRSGWWAVLVAAPVGVALLAALSARVVGLGEAGILRAATGGIGVGYAILAAIVIVELGLRRGQPGYTEHGPPPFV